MRMVSFSVVILALLLVAGATPQPAHAGWLWGDDDDCCCEEKRESCCEIWCRCWHPPAPPRGEVLQSVSGRLIPEPRAAAPKTCSCGQPGAEVNASRSTGDDVSGRINNLERNLTRMSVLVEKLAKSQEQAQHDLNRIGVIAEELAKKQQN